MEEGGVIVAQEVTVQSADSLWLGPMLELVDRNLGSLAIPEGEWRPRRFTADAGYCSERNLGLLPGKGTDSCVATGRERHRLGGISSRVRTRSPLLAAMRAKPQAPEGKAAYARRKAITEPVHGLINQARGFPVVPAPGCRQTGCRIHPGGPDPQPAEAVVDPTSGRLLVPTPNNHSTVT